MEISNQNFYKTAECSEGADQLVRDLPMSQNYMTHQPASGHQRAISTILYPTFENTGNDSRALNGVVRRMLNYMQQSSAIFNVRPGKRGSRIDYIAIAEESIRSTREECPHQIPNTLH